MLKDKWAQSAKPKVIRVGFVGELSPGLEVEHVGRTEVPATSFNVGTGLSILFIVGLTGALTHLSSDTALVGSGGRDREPCPSRGPWLRDGM